MSKIIETGSDSRTKLLSGVEQLANAVVTTLGPNGRNVVIAQQGGMLPQSTKDGVTVAKTIVLKDPVENLGAQMVKQAAVQTGDSAGDGTTTSTLLTRELLTEGMKYLSSYLGAEQFFVGDHFTIADISVFSCLEYLDLRFPRFNWKIVHPNLKNYWDFHKTRQSYLETKPEVQTIETMES